VFQWSTILGFIRGTALLGFSLCVSLSLWLAHRHYAENSQPFTQQMYRPDAKIGQADYEAIVSTSRDSGLVNRSGTMAELGLGVMLQIPVDCCVYRDAEKTAATFRDMDLPQGVVSLSPENGAWTAFMKIVPLSETDQPRSLNDVSGQNHRVIQMPSPGEVGRHRSVEWILESAIGNQPFRNHFIQIEEKGRRLNAVLVATTSEFDRAMEQFRTVLGHTTLKPPNWFEREFYLNAQDAQSRLLIQAIMFLLIVFVIPGKSRTVQRYTVIRVRDQAEQHRHSHRPLFPPRALSATPALAFASGTPTAERQSPKPKPPEVQPIKERPMEFRWTSYFDSDIPQSLVPSIPLAEIIKPRKQIGAPLSVARALQIKRLSHVLPDSVPGSVPLMPSVLYVGIGGAGINAVQHAMSIDMPNMGHAVMDSQSFSDQAIAEMLKPEGRGHFIFSSKSLRYSNSPIRLPVYQRGFLTDEQPELEASLRHSQEMAMDEMLEGTSLLLLAASVGSRAAEDGIPPLIRKAIHHDIPTLAIVSVPFSAEPCREQVTDTNLAALALYGIPYIRFDNTHLPEILGTDAGMFESLCAQTDWMSLLAWSVTHLHLQGKLLPLLGTRGEITFSHAQYIARESLASLVTRAIRNQKLVETGWEGRKGMIVVISSTPPREHNYKKAVQDAAKKTGLDNPLWLHIQDERLGEHKYAIVLGYRGQ